MKTHSIVMKRNTTTAVKNDNRRLANLEIVRRLHDKFPATQRDDARRGYTLAAIAVLTAIEANCEDRDLWSTPGTTWAEATQGQRLGDMIALTRQQMGLLP